MDFDLEHQITFGLYRGKTVEQVIGIDPIHLEEMIGKGHLHFDMDTEEMIFECAQQQRDEELEYATEHNVNLCGT